MSVSGLIGDKRFWQRFKESLQTRLLSAAGLAINNSDIVASKSAIGYSDSLTKKSAIEHRMGTIKTQF